MRTSRAQGGPKFDRNDWVGCIICHTINTKAVPDITVQHGDGFRPE